MKRLWVCAALLLFVLCVCLSARLALDRVAAEERSLLYTAQQAVQSADAAEAMRALAACERHWKENNLPFYLFVNHNFFNQFEYMLFHLRDYAADEPGLAVQQIGYCSAVLQDLADSQKPVLKNIF